jgi:hypothetical protein
VELKVGATSLALQSLLPGFVLLDSVLPVLAALHVLAAVFGICL